MLNLSNYSDCRRKNAQRHHRTSTLTATISPTESEQPSSSALVLSQSVQCGLNFWWDWFATFPLVFCCYGNVPDFLCYLLEAQEADRGGHSCVWVPVWYLGSRESMWRPVLELINTECTPGYCRCGVYGKNQVRPCYFGLGPCSLPSPNLKYFFFHPSHQIFRRMHGALNVGKKDN
jgi:hypothetical protein